MDLQEQRITCLRMAVDMGCKADSVFRTASDLMGFVTRGAAQNPATPPAAEASAPEFAESPGEAAVAATPEAEVAASALSASAAASVEAPNPTDGPAAAAEVGEPVSAA